jgi:hypothetical protein
MFRRKSGAAKILWNVRRGLAIVAAPRRIDIPLECTCGY